VKRPFHASFPFLALTAAAALALLPGCSREAEEAPAQGAADEPSPASPAVYMKDAEFRAKLDERNAARRDLARARNVVVSRMEEMAEAKRKELGTSDEAAVKAALEKDPEWISLERRRADADRAIEEGRRETMRVVRERLTRRTGNGERGTAAGSRSSDVR